MQEPAAAPQAPGLPAAAAGMAEAPADPTETDLEQKILQVLRGAGSPVKAAQLAKDCQVPKKRLNQVLYRMKEEAKVHLEGPATWRLGEGQTGEVVPTERAQPCQAARPQQEVAAIPETPCPQLSKRQMEIYRFLEASGPHKALSIAQALGMRTTKDVNRDLYTLRDRHLLNYDQKTSAWAVYQPENSGGRNQSATVIYQQNPITMICQNGPYSHISIENSEGIQIGHGNTIVRQTGSAENGSAAPLHLPPTTPADASTQGPLAGACSPQDIRIEKSVLRRVQLGHGNEMSFHSPPAEGPAHSPSGSPPVSATSASPEAVFEIRTPEPGPHPQGDMVQRVQITSCFLEDTAIGNSNRMTASPGPAGPEGPAGPGDTRRDHGEPGQDAAAAPSGGERPHSAGQAARDSISTLAASLEAVSLESRGPETEEDGC
ncbi:Z-DNA-binding protein 1 isoform X2 [Diceros bicornis minor]|uniref:Z-DNA-binding protein 1 isoform X2 n=1 Tax=Diceros bicornis minor TaxID=77932 RepID=UPI0026EE7CF4|nr:Z-DNA-binding protein 1 isoform X2 [Diceros bicornis minor]